MSLCTFKLVLLEQDLLVHEPITVAATAVTCIIYTCLKTINPDIIFIMAGHLVSKNKICIGLGLCRNSVHKQV